MFHFELEALVEISDIIKISVVANKVLEFTVRKVLQSHIPVAAVLMHNQLTVFYLGVVKAIDPDFLRTRKGGSLGGPDV